MTTPCKTCGKQNPAEIHTCTPTPQATLEKVRELKNRPKTSAIGRFCEKYLGEHISFNLLGFRVVMFGFNAMHVALNIRTPKGMWWCFHPGIYCFGKWWPMKFYISPDATPCKAVFGFGKGFSSPPSHE